MQFRNEDYDPILHDRFKALFVKQPYAEYIASGVKGIEVRASRPSTEGNSLFAPAGTESPAIK